LGTESTPAVAALQQCLSESMFVLSRERAAWALAQVGSAAASASETLKQAVDGGQPRLSQLAFEALQAVTVSETNDIQGAAA